MKRMRIAMLIDAWDPIVGGGQTHVLELTKQLIFKHNVKIDLFTRKLKDDDGKVFSANETLYKDNLRIFRSGFPSKFFNPFARIYWLFSVIFSVLKQNEKFPYSLIHAHAFLPAIPGKILKFLLKIPLVFTVHGTSLFMKRKNITWFLEKILLCKLKYDYVISVARNFLKIKNTNNIAIIPNGVSPKFFYSKKYQKNSVFTALYVGRFDKIKGVDILIKSFSYLRKYPIRLNIIGYGPEEKNLKNLTKQLNLLHKISFIGKKTPSELIKYYNKSHIFILPSLSEGHPLTILEAWACKLPVIATTVGDNAYYIKKDVDGYLVREGSPEELAEAIKKAYRNDSLKSMGEKGFKKAKNFFDWRKMAKKTYAIYSFLMQKYDEC